MAMVFGIDKCSAGRLLFNFPGPLGYPYVYLFQISLLCAVALAGMALTLFWLKRSGRRLSPVVLIGYGLLAAWSIGLAVALYMYRDGGLAAHHFTVATCKRHPQILLRFMCSSPACMVRAWQLVLH